MDIANYIIYFSTSETNKGLSNLKLQKILYFVYGRYLAKNNLSLFDESIEKWQYGPVTPSVYHTFKDYGVNEINETKSKVRIDSSSGRPKLKSVPFNLAEFVFNDEFDKELVDAEIKLHLKKDAYQLVEETHRHPMWYEYKARIMSGEKGIKYTKDELINYFKVLR